MLGPIGSNLIGILKVLTPSEIERYSQEGMAEGTAPIARRALAAGGEFFDYSDSPGPAPQNTKNQKAQKAKILPFNKNKKEEDEVVQQEHDPYAGFPKEDKNEEDGPKDKLDEKPEFKPPNFNSSDIHIESDSKSELSNIGILSANQIKKIESEKKKAENSQKDSATIFLLKQRRKLQTAKEKLIEQTALDNYKKSQEEIIKEDKNSLELDENGDVIRNNGSTRGILLNKKQY